MWFPKVWDYPEKILAAVGVGQAELSSKRPFLRYIQEMRDVGHETGCLHPVGAWVRIGAGCKHR